MSYYTYETVTVHGDADKNRADNGGSMLGVEVEIEDEDDEVFEEDEDDNDHCNEGIPYLDELQVTIAKHSQHGNSQQILQSPTNYYDAGEGDPNHFFQGSEKVPIVGDDDGYYDEAEQHRFKKIQALNGFGWQYSVEGPQFDEESL
jgi:hypothetical protein